MRVPNIVTVFGESYTLVKTKGLIDSKSASGFIDLEAREILYDSSLKGDKLLVTIVHELLHAYFDRLSINDIVDINMEEILADTLAKFMTETFTLRFKDEHHRRNQRSIRPPCNGPRSED